MDGINHRLGLIRKASGLTLREFSGRLNDNGYSFSHSSVRDYEEGTRVPAEYAAAVCSVFSVSPSWLLFGIGSQQASEVETSTLIHQLMVQVINADLPEAALRERLAVMIDLMRHPENAESVR